MSDGKGALRSAIGLVVRGYLDDDQIEEIATAVLRLGFRLPAEVAAVEWGLQYASGNVVEHFDSREPAEEMAVPDQNSRVVCRSVGPWEVVE